MKRRGGAYPKVDSAHDGDLRAPVPHVLEIAHGSGSLLLHLRVRLQVLYNLRCDFIHQENILVVLSRNLPPAASNSLLRNLLSPALAQRTYIKQRLVLVRSLNLSYVALCCKFAIFVSG